MREEDETFKDIQKEVKKPRRPEQERAAWIPEATCRFSDQRTSLRWIHPMDQCKIRTATRHFQAALQEDRRQRVSTTGTDIEALIVEGRTREAWIKIQWWYQQAKGNLTPPTKEGP